MDTLLYYFFIGTIIVFVITVARKVIRHNNNPVWTKMPGPPSSYPFLGNIYDIRSYDLSYHHSKWAKEYGTMYRMAGTYCVMVSDPALVKYVLLNNVLFDKNNEKYRVLSELLGDGLVTEKDEAIHKYHRSIISPAFATKYLKLLVPIFQEKGDILVQRWKKYAESGETFEIVHDIAKTTSDVIGAAAFGYQLNTQTNNDSNSSIYNTFKDIIGPGIGFFETRKGLRNLFGSHHKRMNAIGRLNKDVQRIINARTQKQSEREKGGEERQRDLLDLMMESRSEEGDALNQLELANHTKTFLFAGYETSSVCIHWTLYLLAKHPEVQEKLANEIKSVIGKNGSPSAEDIENMPYMYQVLRESLRMYPPIPIIPRFVSQDLTLGGYFLPKGTQVTINIYHMHHHSPVWDQPEVFNPERWVNDELETSKLMGSYIPFILGARNCVGSKFATLEVRVVLAMLLQKYIFEMNANEEEPRLRARISLAARNPIKMVLHPRN